MNKVSFGKLETKEIGKQIMLNFKHLLKDWCGFYKMNKI